jgi:hypothetical protein
VPFDKPALPKRKKRGGDGLDMPRYKNWEPEVY